ncbi:scavenger receptor cysteine-rich type 1 protein M130-like [Ptychodera flava]|uniref:scavenger receptor cysteine-rich type 1 protein M130-like n=1 Tax=Ptychodera flava TaxID=63121 RepID=UPI003969F756
MNGHMFFAFGGYSGGVPRPGRQREENGKTKGIWMSKVECGGHESSIFHCKLTKEDGHSSCDNVAVVECEEKDMAARLVGGKNPYEGKLEVFEGQEWRAVSKYGFTTTNAKVVCKELGYREDGARVVSASYYGTGQKTVKKVYCHVNENSLSECSMGTMLTNASEAVGIICGGTVRLNSGNLGNSNTEGCVEMLIGDAWKSIGSTHWIETNTDVLCKELGFSNGVKNDNCVNCPAQSQEVNSLQCTGSERSIQMCRYENIGTTTTSACVRCEAPKLRLVDSQESNKGRLEVQIDGVWGRVCANSWDIHNVHTVCRQLEFPDDSTILLPNGFYGIGTGEIFLNDIDCHGYEDTLASCPSVIPNTENDDCDAAIICKAKLRLVGEKNSPNKGRVEVFMDGEWGRVLDHSWDPIDGKILCSELGFPDVETSTSHNGHYPVDAGQPVHMNGVECNGNPKSLFACDYNQDPSQGTDVIVHCKPRVKLIIDGDGSNVYNHGFVEVYYNGEWKLVCANHFDIGDGMEVCKELGFEDVKAILPKQKSADVWTLDRGCGSADLSIFDCPFGESNCKSQGLAYIICKPRVQLVGEVPYEGEIQMYRNNQWEPIPHSTLDQKLCDVVCKELGFPGCDSLSNSRRDLDVSFNISTVECSDSASILETCQIQPGGISSPDVAYARCEAPFRLKAVENAVSANVQLIEYYHLGKWGLICDDYWHIQDAMVACREQESYSH